MKFTIPCETFYRFSRIISYFQDDTDEEIKSKINTIRLENYKGNLIIVATNKKIAAVEIVCPTDQPDGVIHILPDENLIKQCKEEKLYNSFLEIIYVPDIALASAKTMMGYQYPGNPSILLKDTPLNNWRDWASKEKIKISKGAMYWDMNHITLLNECCPTGKLAFPEKIDIDIPVVLRDTKNPNWVGLFMARKSAAEGNTIPATLPEWWFK